MRHGAWWLAFVLSLGVSAGVRGAAPGSPEDVVEKAMGTLNRGKLDGFVKAMHPEALEDFRTRVLQILDDAVKAGKAEPFLHVFAGVEEPEDLKGLDGGQMVAKMIETATASPDAKEAMAGTRIRALGRFMQQDRAYVVYHSKVKFGELSIDRTNVAVLRKSGDEWKLDVPADIAAKLAETQRASVAGQDAGLPDLKQTRIEPIGHVLEGKTAFVVYRMSAPVGASTISQLAVWSFKSDAPGWDAARKDRLDEVKTVIEQELGLVQKAPKPLPPALQKKADALRAAMENEAEQDRAAMKARSEEVRAGQKKEMEAFAAEASKRSEERMKAFKDRTAPEINPTAPAAAALPDGLIAIPEKFVGGDRDRFQDLAPADGVLVGVRVGFASKPGGGTAISSIRPVFRVGDRQVDGEPHGSLLGKETELVAKPGYAVGAVKMRAAVSLHGFELVYMKVDGDHLDPARSYNSKWVGNERGGLDRNVSTNGKIPVGIQGKAQDAVKALGLIVKP